MTHPIKLPDAMPDITAPTLLVVCDSHHCRFIDVGGHTIVEQEKLDSKESKHTDRQSTKVGPSGGTVGIGDDHHAEEHRLTDFAKMVTDRIVEATAEQKIEALYIAAPSRLLSEMKKHSCSESKKILKSTIDGTFVKEPALEILMRFRPDLQLSVQKLRDQENYSSKKHLPK